MHHIMRTMNLMSSADHTYTAFTALRAQAVVARPGQPASLANPGPPVQPAATALLGSPAPQVSHSPSCVVHEVR